MEKQGGISPRYSPGRDRDHASATRNSIIFSPSKPHPFYAVNTPEMQKAAIGGLIDEIVVHPTAALEIQCSFSSLFSNHSATGNRTPV